MSKRFARSSSTKAHISLDLTTSERSARKKLQDLEHQSLHQPSEVSDSPEEPTPTSSFLSTLGLGSSLLGSALSIGTALATQVFQQAPTQVTTPEQEATYVGPDPITETPRSPPPPPPMSSTTSTSDTSNSNRVPKFDGINFPSWEYRMSAYLRGRKLWRGVMDTTVPLDLANVDDDTWDRNSSALSAIIEALSDTDIDKLDKADVASVAWANLKASFRFQSPVTVCLLEEQLTRTVKLPTDTYTAFATKIREISRQINSIASDPAEKISDQRVVTHILGGLGPSHIGFVSQWHIRPSAEQNYAHLLEQLRVLDMYSPPTATPSSMQYTGLYARNAARGDHQSNHHHQHNRETRTCFHCGTVGHIARNCRRRQHEERNAPSRHSRSTNTAAHQHQSAFPAVANPSLPHPFAPPAAVPYFGV